MESQEVITKLKNELQDATTKNHQLNTALSSGNFNKEDPNAIETQLDTTELLERVEHFLRGDYLSADDEGGVEWKTQDNEDLKPLNEYGVRYAMSVLTMYLDKNTSLSNYEEMRINEILADIGDTLARKFYWSYEKMGMVTEYKKSQYETIVVTIIHTIESAYRKALQGKFREDLNTSRIFTQSDNPGMMNKPQTNVKKKFHPFKMSTW